MATSLRYKVKDLRTHWAEVVTAASNAVGIDRQDVAVQFGGSGLEASLMWRIDPDESAERNLGTSTRVVPLDTQVADGGASGWWLAWYERWRGVGLKQTCEFDSTGITFFFGARGQRKLQVLRAEWVGPDAGGEFDGGHAAHPHWHLDIPIAGAISDYLPALRDQAIETLQELESAPEQRLLPDAKITTLSKVHLSMIARWGTHRYDLRTQELSCHQATPDNVSMLRDWTVSTCLYGAKELRRIAVD